LHFVINETTSIGMELQHKVKISIRNESNNPLPAYATAGSSGLDIRANIQAPLALQPMERFLVPTGLFLAIPAGFEGQVRPRSGLALRQGLTCLNSPGTIDSDYRGEIGVLLINLSNHVQVIQPADRVAQIVFQPVTDIQWEVQDELSETSRGAGGFGHSGLQ